MPIRSYGYITNASAWKQKSSAEIERAGRQEHSEITVYNELGATENRGPYLIWQDAFPCDVCDGKFITASSSRSVVFKITANNGSYSVHHKIKPKDATFPTYIWYHNGKKYITATRPAEFPACPSVDI
jgi:hypothetical protein